MREINIFCYHHQVRCLYFLAGINESITIGLAEKNDFHLVDVRITFEHKSVYKLED